jgi:thioredoxin
MKKFFSTIFLCSLLCIAWSQDKSLTVKEFAEKLNNAQHAQILDARSPEEFAHNHIKGAVSINMADSVAVKKAIEALNPDYPTFTYSINSGRSVVLANRLRELGFKEVYALPGGLANWVGSGYSLETFDKDNSGLTSKQFKQLINSDQWVLVDFASRYCGGCRLLIPLLDSLGNQYQKELKIVRIELDENPGIIKEQKIEALPTLVLFKQGEIVWKHKGIIKEPELSQVIRRYLKL